MVRGLLVSRFCAGDQDVVLGLLHDDGAGRRIDPADDQTFPVKRAIGAGGIRVQRDRLARPFDDAGTRRGKRKRGEG